jgi:hypothetical protein
MYSSSEGAKTGTVAAKDRGGGSKTGARDKASAAEFSPPGRYWMLLVNSLI